MAMDMDMVWATMDMDIDMVVMDMQLTGHMVMDIMERGLLMPNQQLSQQQMLMLMLMLMLGILPMDMDMAMVWAIMESSSAKTLATRSSLCDSPLTLTSFIRASLSW